MNEVLRELDATGLMTVAWEAMAAALREVVDTRRREKVDASAVLAEAEHMRIAFEATAQIFSAAGVRLEHRDEETVAIPVETGTPPESIDWPRVFEAVQGVLVPAVQSTDILWMVREQFAAFGWCESPPAAATGLSEESDDEMAGHDGTVSGAAKAATLRALARLLEARPDDGEAHGRALSTETYLTLAKEAAQRILEAMNLPVPPMTQEEWERGVVVDDIVSGLLLGVICLRDRDLALVERQSRARLN